MPKDRRLERGYQFEKFVKLLLIDLGYHAERNLVYRKRGSKTQVDIDYEYRNGVFRRKKLVVGECKYSGNGSVDLESALEQLAYNMRFADADEGILFTNRNIQESRLNSIRRRGIYVCHRPVLEYLDKKRGGWKMIRLEDKIRRIRLGQSDYQFIYRDM